MYVHKLPNAAASVITVTGTSQTLEQLIRTAASDTSFEITKENAVDLFVSGADVRMLFDGNTPTASLGLPLSAGVMYSFRNVPLHKMRLIRAGSTNATVAIQYGVSDKGESGNAAATSVTVEANSDLSNAVTTSYAPFEDQSFVTGDSPRTVDINAALGRNSSNVTLHIHGTGDVQIELSTDGVTFGTAFRGISGSAYSFSPYSVDSIRLTWIADTKYTIIAA